jgi:hypothetical protein
MMGKALEIIAGRVTNPGATLTALTANTGNSFAVRALNSGRAFLEGIWTQQATAGVVRVRSAKMHDAVQGIRIRSAAGVIRSLIGPQPETPLYSTDTLTFELSGGAAEVDAAALQIFYEDLAGGDANLALWEQISPRIANVLTAEVAVTGPTTSGDWSAGNAINSTFDVLKADTKYALLGYSVDTESLAVGIQGPDTANYRLGGPGMIEPLEARDYFIRQSIGQGRPHILVFNSNNKGGTLVSVCKVGAGGTVNVSLQLAELTS